MRLILPAFLTLMLTACQHTEWRAAPNAENFNTSSAKCSNEVAKELSHPDHTDDVKAAFFVDCMKQYGHFYTTVGVDPLSDQYIQDVINTGVVTSAF